MAAFSLAMRDLVRSFFPALAVTVVSALAIQDDAPTLFRLGAFAILVLAFALGAFRVHRLLLISSSEAMRPVRHRGQRRLAIRYLLNILIVLGLATTFTVPVVLLTIQAPLGAHPLWQSSVVFYGLLFVWSFMLTRLSFYFIARAIDEPLNLLLSWKVTGQFPRMTLYLAALIPLAVFIDTTIVEPLIAAMGCEGQCATVLNRVLFAGAFSFVIVTMTLAYEVMRERSPYFKNT